MRVVYHRRTTTTTNNYSSDQHDGTTTSIKQQTSIATQHTPATTHKHNRITQTCQKHIRRNKTKNRQNNYPQGRSRKTYNKRKKKEKTQEENDQNMTQTYLRRGTTTKLRTKLQTRRSTTQNWILRRPKLADEETTNKDQIQNNRIWTETENDGKENIDRQKTEHRREEELAVVRRTDLVAPLEDGFTWWRLVWKGKWGRGFWFCRERSELRD